MICDDTKGIGFRPAKPKHTWIHGQVQRSSRTIEGLPSRIGRKVPIPHDADLCCLRHRIENMFARLEDWRRIATS
ncbi:hypothetical protein BYZ73_20035 [Rhodovulum viride]|uniref:DDE family transposase n=1 Tax=Rhodovulum viride TaxID=1231134 RepID=A0ABX9DCU9_9RHOB|nr:hypothetical protein BYZ73_20035 [Rhodovulum viride]